MMPAARSPKKRRWSRVPRAFPVVVTSNSGFPLDQNLYQAVKGMSAAAQVVTEGGLILTAAECGDGFPDHGSFKTVSLRARVASSDARHDRQRSGADRGSMAVQLLALILIRARVGLHSLIAPELVRRAHLEPFQTSRSA
jgi:nickel-dependent lactate racemase